MNAVEVENLDKRYGPVLALAHVSVSLPSGTITLLSGPNGAGKSTLLRIIASLTRPTAGRVRVLGRNPFGREGASVRREIGWLGTETGLYAELTVEENLGFAAKLSGCAPERLEAVVADFGLDAVRHRRVRLLSQGYRRRAGLARALLKGPSVLVLDEPESGLDLEATDRLIRVLRTHRDRGGTVIMAAHGASGTAEAADRVLHLERGALSAQERAS